MVKDDWSQCPKCAFPALFSHLSAHLETDPTCPMCEQLLVPTDVNRVPESDIKLGDAAIAAPGASGADEP